MKTQHQISEHPAQEVTEDSKSFMFMMTVEMKSCRLCLCVNVYVNFYSADYTDIMFNTKQTPYGEINRETCL